MDIKEDEFIAPSLKEIAATAALGVALTVITIGAIELVKFTIRKRKPEDALFIEPTNTDK